MPPRFSHRDSNTEELARRLAVQRRIETLIHHLDESVNWRHYVPGADRTWQGDFVWDELVANASVPVLVPPILATQGKQITINQTDDWAYRDYGFSAETNATFLRKTEWLLRDKSAPRNPPFFVIFRLLDDEIVSHSHFPSYSLVLKPPSYFHDHFAVERRDLRPTAPSYTQKHVKPRTFWTEEGKELFALRVRGFLGVHGRPIQPGPRKT
ncbi:hypothetical protein JCM10295v2_000846 [Rhodotorula toruloides]